MTLFRLALRDISRNTFRSWTIFACAMLVAGLALGTLLITRGAQDSLRLAVGRLGADIIVVPPDAETKVESALLMGTPTEVWMPDRGDHPHGHAHLAAGLLGDTFDPHGLGQDRQRCPCGSGCSPPRC